MEIVMKSVADLIPYARNACFGFARDLGLRYRRIHHLIRWNAAVPKIIREEHRKGG